jgi:hypothetical protein
LPVGVEDRLRAVFPLSKIEKSLFFPDLEILD